MSDPKYVELKGQFAVAEGIHAELVDADVTTTFQANPTGASLYNVRVRHIPGTPHYAFTTQKPETSSSPKTYDLVLYPEKGLGHLSIVGFEAALAPSDVLHFVGVLNDYSDYLTSQTQ